jgi:hypothetical protein
LTVLSQTNLKKSIENSEVDVDVQRRSFNVEHRKGDKYGRVYSKQWRCGGVEVWRCGGGAEVRSMPGTYNA